MKSTSSFSDSLRAGLANQQHLRSLAADSREIWNQQKAEPSFLNLSLSTSSTSSIFNNPLLLEAWHESKTVDIEHGIHTLTMSSTKSVEGAINKLQKGWWDTDFAEQIDIRIVGNNAYNDNTGHTRVEFSLRNVEKIKCHPYAAALCDINLRVTEYVAEILDLEKRHTGVRVQLPLHELELLSSELVDALSSAGYQFSLAEQEIAATRINPHLLRALGRQRKFSDGDYSKLFAILGTKIDCRHFWKDLDEIVLGGSHLPGDAVSAVDFPAVPFLLNHLRNWKDKGRNCSAIQWFFARQWSIDIQPFASVLPEFASATTELLDWASRLDQSKVDEERQVGKDLRCFVNFHASRSGIATLPVATLRSRL